LEGIFQNLVLEIKNLPDNQVTNLCDIWGFHSSEKIHCNLLDSYTLRSGR